MSLWRKLAYDLAEDMLVPSEPNNRNMSTVNIAYQLNVRCDLCLWNEEFKIVQQSCPLVLRTAFSLKGSDVLKKNWHRYTQTHINTDTRKDTHTHTLTHIFRHTDTQTHTNTTGIYTHTDTDTQTPLHPWSHTTNTQMHTKPFKQQSHTHKHKTHTTHTPCQHTLTITQQNSLRQCPNCVTVFNVDWLQEQQEVLKVKYWLRVGKEANRPSKKDLNLLHSNHCLWWSNPVI